MVPRRLKRRIRCRDGGYRRFSDDGAELPAEKVGGRYEVRKVPAIQQRQAAEAVTVPRAAATVQETAVHETADTDQEAAIAEATAATVQEKAVPEAVTEVDAVTVEATALGTAVQGRIREI